MKIRTGFVSNSSSSSFVVAFPHKPGSAEDVKKMLFGKQEWHYSGYYADGDASTQQIAERVFAKITKEATEEEMIASVENGWFDGRADTAWPKTKSLNYTDPEDRKKIDEIYKEEDKENHKRATDIVEVFSEVAKIHAESESPYIVVMEFSDNEGEAVEEHSGIFDRMEHIRTSYH